MIQTKEELFIAELGGNPQQEIELSYGAKIKITDLLSKYLKAINYTHSCKSDSEQLFCYSCQAWTNHRHINENNVRCLSCDTNKAK